MCKNCDSQQKVTDVGDWHAKKHDEQRSSTEGGREINVKLLRKNAFSPTHESFESALKAIDRSQMQAKKHDEPRPSTEAGKAVKRESPPT
jgi:hypothetical protein